MIREEQTGTARIDEVTPIGIGAASLLGAVTLALLPSGYEADVVKLPLLVCGAVILCGVFLTIALLRRRLNVVKTPVDILLLLLLLLTAVQTLHAPDLRNARDAGILWGAFGVMYFAGTHAFGNESSRRILARSVVIVVAAVECLAAAQLLIPDLAGTDVLPGPEHRIDSTLGSASLLAAFLAGMLPVLFSEARRSTGPAKGVLYVLITGAFTLLLAGGSRGGLIAALVSAGIYLFLSTGSRKKALVVLGGLICTLAVVIVAVPSLQHRFLGFFAGTGTVSLERRMVIWDAAWNAVRASPLTGHGTGSFESIVPLFRAPDYWMNGSEDIVRHAHNIALELWAETGIAGPVLWLIIAVLTVRRGFAVARTLASDGRDFFAALTAGFIGILVENLAGISILHPAVGGYAWLFAGVILGSGAGEGSVAVRTIAVKTPRSLALLPVVLATSWAIVTMVQHLPLFRSESHYIKARVLETRNDENAQKEFIAAYETCPWNPQAAMSAAGLYFRMGQPAKSLEALDAVQRRFPLYPRSNLLRGMVMASLGRYHDADSCVRRELAIRSGPEGLHVQSIVARAVGNATGEREALLQLLRASMSTGRDFFVGESCARLEELPGPDSAEVTLLVASARQRFGGKNSTP